MRRSMIRNGILAALATLVVGIILGLYLQGSGPMPQVAGTVYTSVQKGYSSDVTVSVTVRDGAVTKVEADVSGETEQVGGTYGPQLCETILAAGTSAGVDAVSGATYTSNAILAGVQDCMVQAGIWDSANAAAGSTSAAS
jgi:major membrane immunogen (membrane-anchored lipoprotein)